MHANSAKGLTITFVEQLAAKVKGHFYWMLQMCVCEKVV